MTEEEVFNEIQRIAIENDLELTPNAMKIARFRARANIPISLCPCEQEATDRGCLGKKCWEEIKTNGVCLCNCFRSKNENKA